MRRAAFGGATVGCRLPAGVALLAACMAAPGRAAEPPAPVAAVAVSLAGPAIGQAGDIALYGVVLARVARRSIALLGIQAGQAFPFRPGDEVAASWRLLAVQDAAAIVADPAGVRYRLAMAPEDGSGRRAAAARLPPIERALPPLPPALPSDEKLEQARREFNLPASD